MDLKSHTGLLYLPYRRKDTVASSSQAKAAVGAFSVVGMSNKAAGYRPNKSALPQLVWDVTAKKKLICGNPQHVIFGGQPGEVALPKVETFRFLPNQINKHRT